VTDTSTLSLSDFLLARYRSQRLGDAWDEGWAACSRWWHENAVGVADATGAINPYREVVPDVPGWHCGNVGCQQAGPHDHLSGVAANG
jgi:hypothetical protein